MNIDKLFCNSWFCFIFKVKCISRIKMKQKKKQNLTWSLTNWKNTKKVCIEHKLTISQIFYYSFKKIMGSRLKWHTFEVDSELDNISANLTIYWCEVTKCHTNRFWEHQCVSLVLWLLVIGNRYDVVGWIKRKIGLCTKANHVWTGRQYVLINGTEKNK